MLDVVYCNNESIFIEFEPKPENQKIWKLIPYFCLMYIIIFSIDYFILFPRTMPKFTEDMTRYLTIVVFPAAGIILLLFKNNYAWFINTVYYILSAMFLIIDFFVETFIIKLKLNEYRSMAGVMLLALSLIILVLLQAKAVREYFKISRSTFIMASIFFVVISVIIITSVYNS